jgi:serine phosphatase RsbU (regulator of sigma subunit)
MAGTALPVLLVEDNPGDALLIREMLAEGGDVRFHLTHATRLQEGLYSAAGAEWSAVLLDLSLPDSHGLETLRRFRERCAAPVVVLTGNDDDQLALEALRHGAQDYLVKGQVGPQRLVHALHFAISRHHAQARLVSDHLQNEAELRMARRIQQNLFPKKPPDLPGFAVHAACHPAVETGGDFFDYLRMTDGSWALVVGDVTHHGVGPALLMASTRAYLRAFAHTGCNLGEMMSKANLLLHGDVGESMVPLVLVHIDSTNCCMHYLNAGHRPGYVLGRHGQVRLELLSTDSALGMYPDGPFRCSAPIPLQPGDLVLVATDGVHEAQSDTGRFGTARLLDFARRNVAHGPERLVEGLYEEVRKFEGGRPQNDDITVLAIQAIG